MSSMDDLIAFLRAMLDEDEQVALAATETCSASWINKVTLEPGGYTDGRIVDDNGYTVLYVEDQAPGFAEAEHIVRWDPARVLAEIDAKRQLLELHVGAHDCPEMRTGTYPDDWLPETPWGKAGETWAHPSVEHFEADEPCPTVRLLALPYADRDGYRDEWRPDV